MAKYDIVTMKDFHNMIVAFAVIHTISFLYRSHGKEYHPDCFHVDGSFNRAFNEAQLFKSETDHIVEGMKKESNFSIYLSRVLK